MNPQSDPKDDLNRAWIIWILFALVFPFFPLFYIGLFGGSIHTSRFNFTVYESFAIWGGVMFFLSYRLGRSYHRQSLSLNKTPNAGPIVTGIGFGILGVIVSFGLGFVGCTVVTTLLSQ